MNFEMSVTILPEGPLYSLWPLPRRTVQEAPWPHRSKTLIGIFVPEMGELLSFFYPRLNGLPEHDTMQHLGRMVARLDMFELGGTPRFEHGDPCCRFIGSTRTMGPPTTDGQPFDVWICPGEDLSCPESGTVLLRYSDEPSEYGSGREFYPEFYEIYKVLHEAGKV